MALAAMSCSCPTIPNADQADSDGDGEGDACQCNWAPVTSSSFGQLVYYTPPGSATAVVVAPNCVAAAACSDSVNDAGRPAVLLCEGRGRVKYDHCVPNGHVTVVVVAVAAGGAFGSDVSPYRCKWSPGNIALAFPQRNPAPTPDRDTVACTETHTCACTVLQ